MGKAALEGQEVLGRLIKCRPNPDIHREHLILPDSPRPSQDETQY